MTYTSINIQGNIITSEILEKIRTEDIRYQSSRDFDLDQNDSVRDEISLAWSLALSHWNVFKQKREKLDATESGTTETRNHWMKPLFSLLGYELSLDTAEEINGKPYAISFRDNNRDKFPVHIVGINQSLDTKPAAGGTSPHALVQEYLNNQEHLYALVSNGKFLRLLRDATRLSRISYLEWNLEQMMEEQLFAEFALLYRVLHVSRMPKEKDSGAEGIIEFYHQEAIASGSRIRDRLSKAVETSIKALANGFLKHPANDQLRIAIVDGNLSAKDYYSYNLRVIYRILFLMVTEERNLVYPANRDGELEQKRSIYYSYYSVQRLSRLVEKAIYIDPRKTDLWQSLLTCFSLFEDKRYGSPLGIAPLGSGLFAPGALGLLDQLQLDNGSFLKLLRNLVTFENENRQTVRVNYADLDVEELGSVYEGLLELHPVINLEQLNAVHSGIGEGPFLFHEGTERKTTGSYYTKPELVNQLIKSALIPVIEERLKQHKNNKEAQAKALLKLKVCDAAAGSGHMLLAAARTIAWYLAKVQTGDDNPAPTIYRSCLREVIQHCIYAVDYNPAAVELCKLALWLEGHNSGKPLSFLDHKIRNGNSLVGVTDLSVLKDLIPDEAYNPVTGDNRQVCTELKRRNRTFIRTRQRDLFSAQGQQIERDRDELRQDYEAIGRIQQDTLEDVQRISERFTKAKKSIYHEERTCDIWTAAFFKTYMDIDDPTNPTSERLQGYFTALTQYGRLVGEATRLAEKHKFFHWVLEFPDVYEQGGFDVMLGNPPWDMIQLDPQEFFVGKDSSIVMEENQSRRTVLIEELQTNNPHIYSEYLTEKHGIEGTQKFIHDSGRYQLSNVGRLNTAPIFTEISYRLVNSMGRIGLIVPTGIATDSFNQKFFSDIIGSQRLISLFDFENRKKLFPDVDSRYKFCLLTMSGGATMVHATKFGFYLNDVDQLTSDYQIFELTVEDLLRLNPNTKTCPVFRTSVDAKITAKIYRNSSVLVNTSEQHNPWGISFKLMFMMNTASHMFNEKLQLQNVGFSLKGNRFINGTEEFLPLYEAKQIWQYDHRYGNFEGVLNRINTSVPVPSLRQYQDPCFLAMPWYWINSLEVQKQLIKTDRNGDVVWEWNRKWFIGFRDVTNATNERTSIFSVEPYAGFANNNPLMFTNQTVARSLCLIGNANSLPFDYATRFKVAGMHMNFFYVEQLPFFQPDFYSSKNINTIVTKALELVYTSWDIKPFADDIWKEADEELRAAIREQWNVNRAATGGHEWTPPDWAEQPANPNTPGYEGCPLPPLKWDEERRAVLKAELDAIYAKLYGLTTEELRYILDPQDVYGPDFPGETFRVLKEKEIRLYGEYRTRRLVLEAWERLQKQDTNWKQVTPQEVLINTKTMREFTLHEGIYSVIDASKYTGVSTEKIRRWFKELVKENYVGLSGTDKGNVDKLKISFHGLVELVVIGSLRDTGITLKKILNAREDLGKKTGKEYPFATNDVRNLKPILNDKKPSKGVITFDFESGNITLDGLDQYNLEFIREFFSHIEFDTEGVAKRIFPLKDSRLIVIDPQQGGGRAMITDKGIEAEVVARLFKGSNSVTYVKSHYNELSEEEITKAVEYWN